MTQHTQEPWHIFEGTVQSDTNWTICDARTKLKNADANARRIVACVNACAGIPTERLESCRVVLMSVDAEKLTEIAKQRDALQDKGAHNSAPPRKPLFNSGNVIQDNLSALDRLWEAFHRAPAVQRHCADLK